MRGPRLLTSTESWNDSMLAAPQSAARRAKWASVIPTSMHAKSKPIFTKAYSFGLVTGSSRRNCFLHLPEVAFKVCNSSPSGGIAMFYFGNRRSRESDNRLEAKSDRLLSEQGIDQAQFGYHEEEEVQGCGLTAIPTLNA